MGAKRTGTGLGEVHIVACAPDRRPGMLQLQPQEFDPEIRGRCLVTAIEPKMEIISAIRSTVEILETIPVESGENGSKLARLSMTEL